MSPRNLPESHPILTAHYVDEPDDRILSFRTITSIISIIQQHLHIGYANRDQQPPQIPMSPRNEKQLRVLSTLATLLVRDNEITAVAVAHPPHHSLTFVACTSDPTPANLSLDGAQDEMAPSSSDRALHFPRGGHFFTIRNPRNDDPDSIIVTLEPQPKPINVEDPIIYLCENW